MSTCASYMSRRVISGDTCRQRYQRHRSDRCQQCTSLTKNLFTQVANQSQELTPQHIILMMGLLIAMFSSLCVLIVWYFGVYAMDTFRNKMPV